VNLADCSSFSVIEYPAEDPRRAKIPAVVSNPFVRLIAKRKMSVAEN
jgi:hypothetical protein